jgi:hypothetical protein
MVDFNHQKPSTVGRKPVFRFTSRSGIMVFADSMAACCRLSSKENTYIAKFQGKELIDIHYPQVDCSFLFSESGFPYDVFLHVISGWAFAYGNTLPHEYFVDLVADFKAEAAKSKDGRSLKAIVVLGLTNDLLSCQTGYGNFSYPKSVDDLIKTRDKWLNKLAELVGVPVFYAGSGSGKNVCYDDEEDDIPLGYIGKLDEKARGVIIARAHALVYNRLGDKCTAGAWPSKLRNKLYYIQKPRLSSRFCDYMGHPGKIESYLQGIMIHNVLVWLCVKAGWQKDLKSERFFLQNLVFSSLF